MALDDGHGFSRSKLQAANITRCFGLPGAGGVKEIINASRPPKPTKTHVCFEQEQAHVYAAIPLLSVVYTLISSEYGGGDQSHDEYTLRSSRVRTQKAQIIIIIIKLF